jgi:acyl carrier protein
MSQPEITATDDQLVLDGSALQTRLAAATSDERHAILCETIRAQAAVILDQDNMEDDSNFIEQGLTSLKALELTRSLMTLTDVEMPLIAVIEYPTPTHLARYIDQALTETIAK